MWATVECFLKHAKIASSTILYLCRWCGSVDNSKIFSFWCFFFFFIFSAFWRLLIILLWDWIWSWLCYLRAYIWPFHKTLQSCPLNCFELGAAVQLTILSSTPLWLLFAFLFLIFNFFLFSFFHITCILVLLCYLGKLTGFLNTFNLFKLTLGLPNSNS